MKHIKIFTALLLPFLLITLSCKEDNPSGNPNPDPTDPLEAYVFIGEKVAGTSGYTVKLYMLESPFVGYNYVVARVVETGTSNLVKDAELMFMPSMEMPSMNHGTPNEMPKYDADMQGYTGTATFIMSSGTDSWIFTVKVTPDGQTQEHEAVFDIDVIDKDPPKMYSFDSPPGVKTYFVAIVEPRMPKVGMNPFEVVVYEMENMMMFPPVEDLIIEIDPQMPSMDMVHPIMLIQNIK